MAAESGLTAHAGRAHSSAMKGIPERQGFKPPGGGAGDFKRYFIGV